MKIVIVKPIQILLILILCISCKVSTNKKPGYKVVAFYTAKNDQAHISFVNEANKWFTKVSSQNNFSYTATDDWNNLNEDFLNKYDLVIFLDTRPEAPHQRLAFENYMKKGGSWIGFHFSAFALSPSSFPNDWDWYQNEFLGCGAYKSNTWRPTSAILKIENENHPVTMNLSDKIIASPNEWYRWEKDLKEQPDIEILLSIDPESFPLGTGPKASEIWHEGYYPVVWTNKKYNMLYVNMGHNDIDYENGTNKELSHTFNNPSQNKMILNTLNWLGKVNQ
ncbi:ThuA domain-containing protein [Robertkochia solimangrovi]|nr:ThuA domain-containing protein [Robertkochia solimangrovi]